MRGIRVDLDVIHDSDEFIWVVCHNEVRRRMPCALNTFTGFTKKCNGLKILAKNQCSRSDGDPGSITIDDSFFQDGASQ